MNGLSSLNASHGLQASVRLFDRSAAALSSATAEASNDLANPNGLSTGPDVVDSLVGMRVAASSVKANIAVARAADEMLGTLLDMQA